MNIYGEIMTNNASLQLSKLTVLLQYTDKIIDETNNLMIDANKQFEQVKNFIIQTERILNPSINKTTNINDKTFIQKIKKYLLGHKDKLIDSSSIMEQLKKHYECSNIEKVLLSMKITEKKILEAKMKCLDLFQSNQKEIQLFTDSATSLNYLNAVQQNEYQNTNSLIKTDTSQKYSYLKNNDNNLEQLLLDFETKQQILHNLTISINIILDNFMVLLSKTSDFISNGTTHKALEIKTILDKMIIEV